MKTKPTKGKSTNKVRFEAFTAVKSLTLGGASDSAIQKIEFKLSDINGPSNPGTGVEPNLTSNRIMETFMRYRITGCTALVTSPDTVGAHIMLAPFKQEGSPEPTQAPSAMRAIQGCQYKYMTGSQDVLRCRILYPVPNQALGTSGTAVTFGNKNQAIACFKNADGVIHSGFLIGHEAPGDTGLSGVKVDVKLCFEITCEDFKFSQILTNTQPAGMLIEPKILPRQLPPKIDAKWSEADQDEVIKRVQDSLKVWIQDRFKQLGHDAYTYKNTPDCTDDECVDD